MKFLCVACDEPMKLTETRPPDASGSLAVLFACPSCERQIAMLTNAMETEMVSSLGVRIGPPEAGGAAGEAARASRCPFSGVVRDMEEAAAAANAGPAWTAEALARLANIPDFVRPMARQGIEHYATSNGYPVVDERVLEEARARFGM
jgi:hypothetical protein